MFDHQLLARLIEESKLTPSEIAREAKLSHTSILRIMSGESEPRIGTLVAIAKVIRIPVSALIGESELSRDKPASYIITVPKSMIKKGEIELILRFI